MNFVEVNLFGVYVAPISVLMVAAWLILVPLRWVADRGLISRLVRHRTLLEFAVYVIILSFLVLLAAN
jgi:protein AaeX